MRDASGADIEYIARKPPVAPTHTQCRPAIQEVAVQWPVYRARSQYESLFLLEGPSHPSCTWEAAKAMYRRQREPVVISQVSCASREILRRTREVRQNFETKPSRQIPGLFDVGWASHPSQWGRSLVSYASMLCSDPRVLPPRVVGSLGVDPQNKTRRLWA